MKYPSEIRFVIDRLRAAGFEAYLVGGALRDALLGREANDFDVTTSAGPEEMQEVFADLRTIQTGLRHGTLTVLVGDMPVEVTTFRIDGEYLDARHPSEVRFTKNLSEDLSRRDFTVNAMAYSDTEGLIDLFGGKADLEAGRIRAVGEPEKRFAEDALRMLRAFRFCSKLGFSIEEQTLRAILACREGLLAISAERIAGELAGILVGQNAHRALELMRESGVLFLVLPEAVLDGAIGRLLPNFETRLAFLLKDTEKEPLLARLHALKLSNASIRRVVSLVELTSIGASDASEPHVRRLLASYGEFFIPFFDILAARGENIQELIEAASRILARGDCLRISELALGGGDLVALGYKGKAVGDALDTLFDAVLDDPTLNQKERLVEFLKQHRI